MGSVAVVTGVAAGGGGESAATVPELRSDRSAHAEQMVSIAESYAL